VTPVSLDSSTAAAEIKSKCKIAKIRQKVQNQSIHSLFHENPRKAVGTAT